MIYSWCLSLLEVESGDGEKAPTSVKHLNRKPNPSYENFQRKKLEISSRNYEIKKVGGKLKCGFKRYIQE